MKIDDDLIRNVAAQINLRTNDPALPPTLRSGVGGSLIYYYGVLALTRGTMTTPVDARAAWLMWLASQGGIPSEIAIEEPSDFDRRVAEGIAKAASEAAT
jgi:hypothetical protein